MMKKHVLLIDNDRFSLSVLQRLVEDLGYDALIGATMDAAVTLLDSQDIEVIVFNQDLEAEWGLSMFDRVRSNERTRNVPMILLSQSSARYTPRMANTEDNMVCFQKPIAIEPFVQHFRSLVEDALLTESTDC